MTHKTETALDALNRVADFIIECECMNDKVREDITIIETALTPQKQGHQVYSLVDITPGMTLPAGTVPINKLQAMIPLHLTPKEKI